MGVRLGSVFKECIQQFCVRFIREMWTSEYIVDSSAAAISTTEMGHDPVPNQYWGVELVEITDAVASRQHSVQRASQQCLNMTWSPLCHWKDEANNKSTSMGRFIPTLISTCCKQSTWLGPFARKTITRPGGWGDPVKWCENSCVWSSGLTWGDMSSDVPHACSWLAACPCRLPASTPFWVLQSIDLSINIDFSFTAFSCSRRLVRNIMYTH